MIAELLVWSGFFYAFLALPLAIADTQGWRLTQVMGGYSVGLVVLALATPLAGRLIDQGHARVALPLGAGVGALALILLPFASAYPLYVALWAVIGAAMGLTLYEPAFATLNRARGDRARGGITAIALVAGAASLFTFPLAHGLSQSFGWPVAFWTFAALILLIAAPLLVFAAHRLEIEARAAGIAPSPKPASARGLFQDRRIRSLMMVFLLPALGSGLILSQIVPLFAALELPVSVAIAAAAAIGPMQIVARLVIQAIARHRSARDIVLAACLCLTAAALCLAVAGQAVAAVVVFVIAFGAGNGLVGIFRPLAIREVLGPDQIATKTGAIAMPALLALAAAPLIGARILETADPMALLAIAGAAPLLAALALGAWTRAPSDPD